jgi:hypothetical protein
MTGYLRIADRCWQRYGVAAHYACSQGQAFIDPSVQRAQRFHVGVFENETPEIALWGCTMLHCPSCAVRVGRSCARTLEFLHSPRPELGSVFGSYIGTTGVQQQG